MQIFNDTDDTIVIKVCWWKIKKKKELIVESESISRLTRNKKKKNLQN
jgi:hypothetical protein